MSNSRLRRKSTRFAHANTPMVYRWRANASRDGQGKLNGGFDPPYEERKVTLSNIPYGHLQMTLDQTNPGPPYLSGGKFRSEKHTYSEPLGGIFGGHSHVRSDLLEIMFQGFVSPGDVEFQSMAGFAPTGSLSTFTAMNFPSLAGLGGKVWTRTKPKLEQVSGAVFAAESRDLPRMLKTTASGFHDIWKSVGGNLTSASMSPKKVADHFLNHQFGWSPFLSDIGKMFKTISNHSAVSAKLSSQNGRPVRKRVTILEESTDGVIATGLGCPISVASIPNVGYLSGPSTWELRESTIRRVTGVGKFTFYRPEFDVQLPTHNSALGRIERAMTIYGLRISPSNIYKATPWTWALDWFTSMGDYVDHLTDVHQDSVSALYCYVMQHLIRRRTFIQTVNWLSGPQTLTFTREIETKQREPANSPFGFDLAWEGLSPRQIAIAAALGITRVT